MRKHIYMYVYKCIFVYIQLSVHTHGNSFKTQQIPNSFFEVWSSGQNTFFMLIWMPGMT